VGRMGEGRGIVDGGCEKRMVTCDTPNWAEREFEGMNTSATHRCVQLGFIPFRGVCHSWYILIKSVIRPIRTLAPELIAEIFLHTLPSDPLDLSRP